MGDWTLFSNHGHVLICLARDREVRLRSVAADVGITERAVQKIVRELQEGGFITISKHGRCNRYKINTRRTLRHALETRCTVGRLLQLFSAAEKRTAKAVAEEEARVHASETVAPGADTDSPVTQSPEPSKPKNDQSEAASQDKAHSAAKKKSTASGEALDTRQQGSLF